MSGANGAGDDRSPAVGTGAGAGTAASTTNPAAASLNHLTPSEIKALQKQWRLEKRRELEARNRKKQAKLQHADASVPTPHTLTHAQAQTHASMSAMPAVSASTTLPMSVPMSTAANVQVSASLPVSASNSLRNAHLGPPVKRLKAAYLADNPYPPHQAQLTVTNTPTSAAAATYQHYEYVGMGALPMGALPQPATTAATTATATGIAPAPDDSARTLEAQRAWREQKMREVAEKRNKAAPSKRCRRKVVQPGADEGTAAPQPSASASLLTLGADALHEHEQPADESTIAPIVTSLPMPLPVGATDPLAQQDLPPASSADLVNLAGPLSAYGFINTPTTVKDEPVEHVERLHVGDQEQRLHVGDQEQRLHVEDEDQVQVDVHPHEHEHTLHGHAQDEDQVHQAHQVHHQVEVQEHKSQVVHSETTGNEKLEATYQTDFNIEPGDELVGNVQHAWTDLGN